MAKIIDFNLTVLDLCKHYPEIIPIMKELGFENITNPAMLHSAGRVMTISNGCRMKRIPLDTVKAAFQKHGFTIKE
ncbi:DUF1858 domain-containing protein [Bacillus sp. CECT 9360]|uniref:DUF1858 domain-containing protein n=1 Tax=Bacillus sp. CECT 9360 TaxID=2845821 RepID=UPI001E5C2D93|nr:DUF1858 domain-containing protein [Bacillus sp. CECT 9360]CAH0345782.1 hypothetical protein BCI9360_02080 [Bacillus sp. CECT 9360]